MAAAAVTPAELQALILQLQTQVATLTSGAAPTGPAPAAVVFADTPQLGGPVEKMSFIQIVHTIKVSTQIHSSISQYDVYKWP